MSANGLLENPAMFAGYTSTPKQCVADWVRFFLFFVLHLLYKPQPVLSGIIQHVYLSEISIYVFLN